MKKIYILLFLICLIPQGVRPIHAQTSTTTSITYLGSNLDEKTSIEYSTLLGDSKYKIFNSNNLNSIFSISNNESILSGVKVTSQEKNLNIEILNSLKKSQDIDTLGYIDFLLTLGIYNADVKIIDNNEYLIPIAEIIQSYNELGNTISKERITSVLKQKELYDEVVKETKDINKTSSLFFNIEKEAMEEPELQIPNHSVVDISLGRENLKISNTLRDKLYVWFDDYYKVQSVQDGFLRNVFISSDLTDNKISISYDQLSTISKDTDYNPNYKFLAFALVSIFIIYILYLGYRQKRNINNKNT